MHVFKISVWQKVVGQTSWLAHWEQKVGGQLPALPNRLRRQCSQSINLSINQPAVNQSQSVQQQTLITYLLNMTNTSLEIKHNDLHKNRTL